MTDLGIVEQVAALLPTRDAIAAMTPAQRQHLLAELTLSTRMVESATLDVVDTVDRTGEYRDDGHLTCRAWLAAVTNEARFTCSRRVRNARALRTLPQFRTRFRDGGVPVGHIDTIGMAWSNPRVRDDLPIVEDQLISQIDDTAAGFESFMREFVRLADADGAHQHAETAHADRRAHLSKVGDYWRLDAVCGPAQGVVLRQIFDAFRQAAFDTDRAAALARNGGGDVTADDLDRSSAQRSMDALFEVFTTAAAATPGLRHPAPLVNLVIDVRTYDEAVHWLTTGVRPAKDLSDLRTRVCRTTNGDHVPPEDAVAAILHGQIRRVIVDSNGTVIDLGRKRRLFTGNARDAVMLRSTTCVWPGCERPAGGCQADHVTPWSEHGTTDAANGAPLCGSHNRFKHRGFTVNPTAAGRWRASRPDGTHINSPPAA